MKTNTPVYDFIKKYRAEKARFHMPGHKGKGRLFKDDITEIDGADVLYRPEGIIAESEKNASAIFGSKATFYSTEGSSLCIRAAIFLIAEYARYTGRAAAVAAARNVHSSFVSACALTDVEPTWLYGKNENLLAYSFDKAELTEVLAEEKPVAVYITSPDYLGNRANIAEIADICHAHGALLMVDNAHGAYLAFTKQNLHPLESGADLCVESAHKTLPCLTGTAYLHIGKNAPDFLAENANYALNLFASTSPSYLLIYSLDRFNGNAGIFAKKVKTCQSVVENLKLNLEKNGYTLVGNEPLKITLNAKKYGYYGEEIAKVLRDNRIIAEFYDKDFLTLMFSPYNSLRSVNRLEKALLSLRRKPEINEKPPKAAVCQKVLSVRDAVFSAFEDIPVSQAEGRILAGLTLSCPPAVPIAVSGERLTAEAIAALKYYGVSVIKAVRV